MKPRRIVAFLLALGAVAVLPWGYWLDAALYKTSVSANRFGGLEVGKFYRWEWQGDRTTLIGDYWVRFADGTVSHFVCSEAGTMGSATKWDASGEVMYQRDFPGGDRDSPPWLPHPDYWSMKEVEAP